jgi:hypothetical protein
MFPAYARVPFDYYVVRSQHVAADLDPLYPTPDWGVYFPSLVPGAGLTEALVPRGEGPSRVWLVTRDARLTPDSASGLAILTRLAGYEKIEDLSYRAVYVQLFSKAQTARSWSGDRE